MTQPFSLLGVDGLLLPGTEERPCPGYDHEASMDDDLEKFILYLEVNGPHRILAEKAATASAWFRREHYYWSSKYMEFPTYAYEAGWSQKRADERDVEFSRQIWNREQSDLWQRVFEIACERMAHETKT